MAERRYLQNDKHSVMLKTVVFIVNGNIMATKSSVRHFTATLGRIFSMRLNTVIIHLNQQHTVLQKVNFEVSALTHQ